VQVDPIKPTLEPTGTKRLKLKCDVLLSTSAFKFNMRRYMKWDPRDYLSLLHRFTWVGRCRLTVHKPVLKAPMVSVLETRT